MTTPLLITQMIIMM